MKLRIGLGKDSHRFANEVEFASHQKLSEKPLIIGGVHVQKGLPFIAHSDGDVLYHAVFNALSSALGMNSIGHHFSDTDAEEKDRDSSHYLKFIAEKLESQKARIENMSIVVECRTPKIDPICEKIKVNLASLLPVKEQDISITATTGEELSPWGKGQGVEVLCNALLSFQCD